MSILIKHADFVVQSADSVKPGWDVLIEGNRIAAVGPDLTAEGADVIDAAGKVVIPGLMNAHTHLYQTLLRGVRDDVSLVDWCEHVLFPAADVIHQNHWKQGDETLGYCWSALGVLEMIKGGTTCCANMDMTMDAVYEAWADIGFRGVATVTLVDQWLPGRLRRDPDLLRAETLGYVERWHLSPAHNGRIQVALAPSTPFLASEDLILWAHRQCTDLGLDLHMHVAETEYEVASVQDSTGLTPVQFLDSLGVINDHFIAVHCVHVTDEDIETLKIRGAIVVHNPKSNMKIGSGIAPIARLLAEGVDVALATDGSSSNDLLDMFEEMRAAALLQSVAAKDPSVISATDVFRMATETGAKACGIDAGTIQPGRLADLAIVNLQKPHLEPIHDVLSTLVYCAKAADVETTIIDGRVVMDDRELTTVDEREILRLAQELGPGLYERSLHSTLHPEKGKGLNE